MKIGDTEVDGNALNSVSWDYIELFHQTTGEVVTPTHFNSSKMMIAQVIARYLELTKNEP